jgi:hypothetical protein
MLSYELARAINSDRERDIRRAVHERWLRAAAIEPARLDEGPLERRSEAPARASRLAASRLR